MEGFRISSVYRGVLRKTEAVATLRERGASLQPATSGPACVPADPACDRSRDRLMRLPPDRSTLSLGCLGVEQPGAGPGPQTAARAPAAGGRASSLLPGLLILHTVNAINTNTIATINAINIATINTINTTGINI